MKKNLYAAFFAAALMAATGLAQNEKPAAAEPAKPPEPKYYRLDFVVRELNDGKVANSRSYSTAISTRVSGSIRSGTKVPFRGKPENAVQYFDVGVNIDCREAKEVGDRLAMFVLSDISSAHSDPPAEAPTILQTRWSSDVIVPLRKPTVIFSSDDPGSKRQMQLEVTATPVK